MNFLDFLLLAVIAVILGLVIRYICRQKKKGVRCIGCPDSGACAGNCSNCSGNCCGCGGKSAQL